MGLLVIYCLNFALLLALVDSRVRGNDGVIVVCIAGRSAVLLKNQKIKPFSLLLPLTLLFLKARSALKAKRLQAM